MRLAALMCVVCGVFATAANADNNWPKWRGPQGTGAIHEANPPTTWSETENIRWKVKIPGSGTSTPIIWENKIFLQTAIPVASADNGTATGQKVESGKPKAEEDAPKGGEQPRRRGSGGFGRSEKPTTPHQFVLLCLDRKTGKMLWQKVASEEIPHEGHHKDHGFSSASPVTDGEHLIAFFGSRGLYCYDLDGNLQWKKDLGDMQTRNAFGEGASPALQGNVVVVNWDHEGEDFIVALDKRTGDELWRQPRSEPTTWATPLIVEHNGKYQVVTPGTERVRTYDLETGKVLWETEGLTLNAIPTPVTREGIVYLMAGFRGNKLIAVKLGGSGDLTDSDSILWSYNKYTPYVPSPLLYGHRLYFFASNNGILSCVDVNTGKPLIEAKRIGALAGVYASPVGASDHVYLVDRDGTTVVIKNADEYQVVATNKLDERFDASPAIAGNEIYLRGHEYLYSIAK